MGIAQFIQDYGYFAVALGSFLEGEAVLLAGSLAAFHGHLELPLVFMIAALASFLGDLPYFFAGRRFGPAALRRSATLRKQRARITVLLQRHHVMLVLSLRFLYGLRIAGLMALGASRMSPLRFLFLDFVGAIIWASTVCATGYGAGRVFQGLFDHFDKAEQLTLGAAFLVGTSLLIMLARRRRAAA